MQTVKLSLWFVFYLLLLVVALPFLLAGIVAHFVIMSFIAGMQLCEAYYFDVADVASDELLKQLREKEK